jgi:hypothetical protein
VTGPGGFTIAATISNLPGVEQCFGNSTYFDLLRVGHEGEPPSNPPEKPKAVLTHNRVVLTANAVLSGTYVVVAQEVKNCTGTQMLVSGDSVAQFNVPPDAKTPFTVDLGMVELPLRSLSP